MASNFPSNPTDGQIFETYIYQDAVADWVTYDLARDSALTKLINLGLTPEEITALVG
jgi:hypothetical protein